MTEDALVSFSNYTCSREDVIKKICDGEYLVLAADEQVLETLPSGNWIGGTIPYFMAEEGGTVDQSNLFVTQITGCHSELTPNLKLYETDTISHITQDAPEHGFTILILPANSEVHLNYARDAPDYKDMFFSPIIGWVSGVHLNDLYKKDAKIAFGPDSGMLSHTHAVAIHIPLPERQTAEVKIINLFTQGEGSTIQFNQKGFSASSCVVDGNNWNLAEYIKEKAIDIRIPLVANYCGVMVNVSIQEVSENLVKFYGPVFPGVEYRFANPVVDYIASFNKEIEKSEDGKNVFSCNCILNFIYSQLDEEKTGNLVGPMTFGEIAYQLFNQTLVYLSLDTQQ